MAHPKGGYRLDGKRVPGVTTIIGRFKDSGGLMYWAYSQGQANERGEIATLYEKRDESAESGTLAHSMVEAYLTDGDEGQEKFTQACVDDPKITPETLESANNAYLAFYKWWLMTDMTIVEQEMGLVSTVHRFGGCPDAVGMVDGELCLIDWKTSNAVYSDYLIQLAAYKILWEENHPDRPITGGFHLCRFAKQHGDFAHHYYPNLDEAAEQFLLFRRAYEIDKELKKRAK